MNEKNLKEIDAEELMSQISICQLSYNQVDIDALLTECKFDEIKINDYIEKREKSDDKDLKIKGEIERKLFDKGAFASIEGYTYISQESSGTGFGAIAFAQKISEQVGVSPKEITVVGHSLGGGLAQSVAIYYDATAYTFNGVGTVQ